ncbi:MAG: aspartate kinase [Bacteroidales bacterium]|nr:aspartate kinase [Bacteroidales bacterium]
MIVMKFGGTSVQDAQAIARVTEIVRGRLSDHPLVVVSAMARVTRTLCDVADAVRQGEKEKADELLDGLLERHHAVAEDLLSDDADLFMQTIVRIDDVWDELAVFVDETCGTGRLSDCDNARIISTGELLSSILVSAALNAAGIECGWLDARDLVVTDENYLSARPDLAATQANVLSAVRAEDAGVLLTQGFIARTEAGDASVLGFEGSDYSAAIFGMCLDAGRVEIWTDVDGIRSADPRIVERTCRIPVLSYEEAAEMAALGARVLHPLTIGPARSKGIPICVLNSREPSGAGSKVCADGDGIPAGAKSIALLTAQDARELRSRTIFDVGSKAQVSVIGKGIAAQKEQIVSVIRSADEGCAVSLAENGLSLSAIVEKDLAHKVVSQLHNELFA